jgi:hypothetical protein
MNPIRKAVIGAALVGSTIAGGAVGAALIGTASADTTPSTTAPSSASPSTAAATPTAGAPAFDPTRGGHTANGITEAVLTGDAKTKAEAAALAAVPGGTIQRVENDAEGAVYEAHMTKADGSRVTVKMDASFNVTGVESGPAHP